jgi:hypothetical protein
MELLQLMKVVPQTWSIETQVAITLFLIGSVVAAYANMRRIERNRELNRRKDDD